ncbi:hypothetical protein TNCV_2865101, partial [Trichonephila clavipes]
VHRRSEKPFSPQRFRRDQESRCSRRKQFFHRAICFQWDNGTDFKKVHILASCLSWPNDPLYPCRDFRHGPQKGSITDPCWAAFFQKYDSFSFVTLPNVRSAERQEAPYKAETRRSIDPPIRSTWPSCGKDPASSLCIQRKVNSPRILAGTAAVALPSSASDALSLATDQCSDPGMRRVGRRILEDIVGRVSAVCGRASS